MSAGPEYIDSRKLYGLQDGETVLYSLFSSKTPQKDRQSTARFLAEEIDADPAVAELLEMAREDAKQIEEGPVVVPDGPAGSMSSMEELQGLYRGVRIVPARSPISGHREKGWTLIGTPI